MKVQELKSISGGDGFQVLGRVAMGEKGKELSLDRKMTRRFPGSGHEVWA